MQQLLLYHKLAIKPVNKLSINACTKHYLIKKTKTASK